ncbi:MAG: OsmC family protein [Armatimonadetes bacterium]|nr:OsmC family protein [Armatimonadota bacterium]
MKKTLDSQEAWVLRGQGAEAVSLRPEEISRWPNLNGGELLVLAVATCYANDIFREASGQNVSVNEVEVQASAEFDAAGQPASSIDYRVFASGESSDKEIQRLIVHVDSVAEVHLTIRNGVPVRLVN